MCKGHYYNLLLKGRFFIVISGQLVNFNLTLTIDKINVSHVFIVADIVDEVIIDADFMIAHGINLNMGQ